MKEMNSSQISLIVLFAVALCSVCARISQRSGAAGSDYQIVCYLGSWANYRQGDGKFPFSSINPKLCTTIIYSFAVLKNGQIASHDNYLDLPENYGLNGYAQILSLKKKNPHLKVLIAFGGWGDSEPPKYSNMAANPATRKMFVDSVLPFLKKHGFDGLDMDWEFPVARDGRPEDRQNFITLLEELRSVLKPQGLLLTAAVSAGKATTDLAYDVPRLHPLLDAIHLMAYDFSGTWKGATGMNAPLYAPPGANEDTKQSTVDFAVNYWISLGAPKEKLILGLGFYGRSFTLANPSQNGVNAPITGAGAPGPFTAEGGMLGFNEICLKLSQGWTEAWDDASKCPYAYQGNQWVGYDNQKSLSIKVDYLKEKGLGGAMIWAIDMDDFLGKCYGKPWYLLQTIADKLIG